MLLIVDYQFADGALQLTDCALLFAVILPVVQTSLEHLSLVFTMYSTGQY